MQCFLSVLYWTCYIFQHVLDNLNLQIEIFKNKKYCHPNRIEHCVTRGGNPCSYNIENIILRGVHNVHTSKYIFA